MKKYKILYKHLYSNRCRILAPRNIPGINPQNRSSYANGKHTQEMERFTPRMPQKHEPAVIQRSIEFFSKAAEKDFYKVPPRDVIITFITQLEARLALGLSPTIPIDHLGNGAIELKVNGSPAFRCVYTMKKPGQVVVLHTFAKTTNGPDVKNVQLAQSRAKKL